jgi:iron complex outermembrane receptor protein
MVGTKTNTPVIEARQSISVLTREQMDAGNVQREGEASRCMAGVYSEPYGGDPHAIFDAPYIRGFDARANGGYLDGLKEANGVTNRE